MNSNIWSSSGQEEEEGEGTQGRAEEGLVEGGGWEEEGGDNLGLTDWHLNVL